ncbi:hypothetical protein K1719_046479 [Acacia pycnantha]|nr:hypothetical protein K1719_046479 [Acacia pycnantha]
MLVCVAGDNIMMSPPCIMTTEEVDEKQPEQDKSLRHGSSSRMGGGICLTEPTPLRRAKENHQEDCLPFFLDDDSCPGGSPSFSRKTYSIKSTYGFDLNAQKDRAGSAFATSNNLQTHWRILIKIMFLCLDLLWMFHHLQKYTEIGEIVPASPVTLNMFIGQNLSSRKNIQIPILLHSFKDIFSCRT